MGTARELGVAALLYASSIAGCGVPRVDAVVESDQPFVIPGVDEGICLAHSRVRMRNKPRLGASRTHSRYPTESVVAPEDARIHVGALSFPVEQGNDAEMAISDSRGWSRDAYVYKWHAGDEDRMPPPEALIRMAQRDRRTGTYSALLTVVCDGNHDCRRSGSDWMTETLDRLEWRVDVIPCGQTFEYAGPMPE